ncbi:antitoxin Xre/MbcA/ParS toxin-binding domain-containing protein [Neoaquamicrobium sediminum]
MPDESLVLSYMDRTGRIAVNKLADEFGMSKTQLAEAAGLARETLYRAQRSHAPKTQGRLREMLEIISRVTEWAGGKEQAMAWYRAQPLPAFGCRTAEALVKEGKAAAVRDYLDHMALGGFA